MLISRLLSFAAAFAAAAVLTGCSGTGGKYFQNDGPSSRSEQEILDSVTDVTPRLEQPHRAANRPYTVMGKRYYPVTGDKPMVQEGVASWYGTQFHGKKTSIGERYNMYAMTAAHPTMELPSYARVTNLSNGRSVIVRVNDRGPFLGGRIIDMSYAAAIRLGYHKRGTARVRVERITRRQIASSSIPAAPRIEQQPIPAALPRSENAVAVRERIVIASASVPAASPIRQSVIGAQQSVPSAALPPEDPMSAVVSSTAAPAPDSAATSGEPIALTLDVEAVPEASDAEIRADAAASALFASGAKPAWSAQIGAFRTELSAQQTAAHAEMMLSESRVSQPVRIVQDGALYRVLVGKSADAQSARNTARIVGEILGQKAFAIFK